MTLSHEGINPCSCESRDASSLFSPISVDRRILLIEDVNEDWYIAEFVADEILESLANLQGLLKAQPSNKATEFLAAAIDNFISSHSDDYEYEMEDDYDGQDCELISELAIGEETSERIDTYIGYGVNLIEVLLEEMQGQYSLEPEDGIRIPQEGTDDYSLSQEHETVSDQNVFAGRIIDETTALFMQSSDDMLTEAITVEVYRIFYDLQGAYFEDRDNLGELAYPNMLRQVIGFVLGYFDPESVEEGEALDEKLAFIDKLVRSFFDNINEFSL